MPNDHFTCRRAPESVNARMTILLVGSAGIMLALEIPEGKFTPLITKAPC
jgi:hypothetical protein